jgi:hypothetical protein
VSHTTSFGPLLRFLSAVIFIRCLHKIFLRSTSFAQCCGSGSSRIVISVPDPEPIKFRSLVYFNLVKR